MSNSTDPRVARSRDAILVAARSLLIEDGPAAVTHQRVAQQAGVGRATVYRHWPQAELLVHDVMASIDLPYFHEPQTPVRPWLYAQLRKLADEMVTPEVAAFTLTLVQGAVWNPHVAVRRDHCLNTLNNRLAAALALAVESGEFEISADPADLSAVLVGPLIYRAALQAEAVSSRMIDQLLDGLGKWHEVPARKDVLGP
ncbi:TetR/AcrR family transcriptional regulator [Micromonospora sp. NPDC050417]|uniref:TetR/AcrR family transcriptional regulator n=1 Tax=Micromonospora sp. NPDC050417 TaxID=3364280 RepID=UPI003795AB45